MSEEKKLTDKQKRFCEEYVIDWNGTRAAKAAGYSENTAQVIGSENLAKPIIQAYIEEIQQDLAKLCGVSAARNINELKKIAYSNLADFKNGWMSEKDFDELTEDQKAALSEIKYVEKEVGQGRIEKVVLFKVHDKQRAIEGLNKMLGFNAPEKTQTDINLKTENLTDEELDAKLKSLGQKR